MYFLIFTYFNIYFVQIQRFGCIANCANNFHVGSHKASEVLVSDERKQTDIEELTIQITQGNVST